MHFFDFVQAKMEEERRAAVAAREAARAHVKAMAQQREVARQQQASQLRDKVTARLKQAAERRSDHQAAGLMGNHDWHVHTVAHLPSLLSCADSGTTVCALRH
jgi:hypothetical protein